MEQLFHTLTHAIEGSALLALSAAFVWGVVSVVLSPCHLSSIPLIVGFIGAQGRMTTRRALLISALFAAGILCSLAILGVLTAAPGACWVTPATW
jgi:cytochrome c-type biogenesis protein